MNPATIIQEARHIGVTLVAQHGKIIARPAGRLPEPLRQAIRGHKSELLTALIVDHYGVSLADLRDAAGSDWPEVEHDLSLLEALARAIQTRRMRERGAVPPSYTTHTFCCGCNATVPIFPGVAEKVLGCPWCFNRAAGRPVPRVDARKC